MTETQLQDLKELYAERVLDGLDVKVLEQIVFDQLLSNYNELNEREFLAELNEFCDEDEVAEMVETVCLSVI